MKTLQGLIFTMVFFLAACLWAQVGSERGMSRQTAAEYPAEWPQGPGPETVPAWAKPGAIRIARWDGGRIEAAKAVLSGWPGFNPPNPDNLYTMSNWYNLETIHLLRDAAGPQPIQVEVPDGVLYNIVQQPATGSVMIHFLNYTLKPSAEIRVGPQQKFAGMHVFSPDSSQPIALIGPPGLDLVMKIPSVRVYSLLVMQPRGNYPPKWPASIK